MPLTVEAGSLTQITELASNPPRFPRNPTEAKREPLVLYIARVPGKRDLILSTLKPKLKNVSAEDVNSSLYYLHLDVTEDIALAEKARAEDKHEGRASLETIHRKPVLTSAANAQSQPFIPPPSPTKPSQLPRKPLISSEGTSNVQPSASDSSSPTTKGEVVIPRRPLGPRPPQNQASIGRKPLPSLPGIENSPMQGSKSPNNNFELSPERNFPKDFSVTLIRRDPTSSAQWNVGRISSYPLFSESALIPALGLENSHRPVFVYIDNPGYTKFHQNVDHRSAPKPTAEQVRMGISMYSGFERQIHMTWGPPSNRNSRGFSISRPGSSGSKSSEGSNASESSNPGRARGYTFLSPWDGLCSFSTSAGGRSLKCRHALSGNGLKIDPIEHTGHASAQVSELRINLPGSAMFAQKATTSKTTNVGRLAASKFSHIKNKLSSDSSKMIPASLGAISGVARMRSSTVTTTVTDDEDENDDDDGLDELGREKAGGGNRGKRVKLAKLIIQHEGLQMLDLIVAANMAIFWKIWDR